MQIESLVAQMMQDPSFVSRVCADSATKLTIIPYLKAQICRHWEIDFNYALQLCDLLNEISVENHPAIDVPPDPAEIAEDGEMIRSDPKYADTRLFDSRVADEVIRYLKAKVDEHWWKEPRKSVEYAEAIQRLGVLRKAPSEIALGVMAYGDSLRIQGMDIQQAWCELDRAGQLFLQDGNVIGWARTRIGRVAICADFNCVNATLAEVQKARQIFVRYDNQEYLLRLDLNTALAHNNLGNYKQAADTYEAALQTAGVSGEAGQQQLGAIYTNLGFARMFLGDFRRAMTCFQQGRDIFVRRGEIHGKAIAELNIAYIEQAQGHFNRALQRLYEVQTSLAGEMPLEAARAKCDMVECYLNLNRHREARQLASEVIAEFEKCGAPYDLACALRLLATAEAELGRFGIAQQELDQAEALFASLEASTWVAVIHLLRGRIALRKGTSITACEEALAAATFFTAKGLCRLLTSSGVNFHPHQV